MLCRGLPATLAAQHGATNGEWRTWGGDLGVTRYAPLDQINAANFSTLQVAWRFRTENLGSRPDFNLQTTPLMINGVLYATAGEHRNAVALDAATGELLWMHRLDEGQRAQLSSRRLSGRGVGYWTDGKGDERIFYVTIGYQLVGLDAKTGVPLKDFGVNGVVDLKKDIDQELDPIEGEIAWNGAPVVAKNVVLVGAAHRAGTAPRSCKNTKGYIRGFDARTGKRLWIFHTIPQPGEFGNDTWLEKSWEYTGNTGVWTQMTVDEQLGIAYLPVEIPTGDYLRRPSARQQPVRREPGRRRSADRQAHLALPVRPPSDLGLRHSVRADPRRHHRRTAGRSRRWRSRPSRASSFVFDRKTGEPVWPIEERPVEQGHGAARVVFADAALPHQAAAVRAPGLPRGLRHRLHAGAEGRRAEAARRNTRSARSTRRRSREARAARTALLFIPNGANWPGGSFDPETGMLYVYSHTLLRVLSMVNDPKRSDMALHQRRRRRSRTAAAAASSVQGLPLIKPPWGRISAIDLNKGEIVWQIAHGETPDAIKNNPALKGVNIPRTGRPGGAGGSSGGIGTLVTKTLVISGEGGTVTMPDGSRGAMLRAYDKRTGAELGAVRMPGAQTGSPMTYMLGGKQYIVVASSSSIKPGELVAYKLP